MTFDEAAAALASKVRATGKGFLSIRREELRREFGIGRFTDAQARSVDLALEAAGLFVHPYPFHEFTTLRLYDAKHPIGEVAKAVADPDEISGTALENASRAFAREAEGRNLRSDDAPWIKVFDLFLQAELGRELEEWEDVHDDRHPMELAHKLGEALELSDSVAGRPTTRLIAASLAAFRPRRRLSSLLDGLSAEDRSPEARRFVEGIAAVRRRQADEYDRLLRQAAHYLLDGKEIPTRHVEVGLLGLRYRREELARGVE